MTEGIKEKVVVISRIEGFAESEHHDSLLTSAMQSRHDKVIKDNLKELSGALYNYDGDGIAVIFEEPMLAVEFAIKIQQDFLHYPKIPVMIAIHKGELDIIDDKISGEVVETTNKIANSSQAGSVVITAIVNDSIKDSSRLHSEFIEIFEWQEDLPDVRLFAITDKELVVPEASEIDADIKPLSEIGKKGRSSIWHILISIGTLIIASAIFAYLNVLATDPVIDDYSIAVLPFNNLGNTEESEILSEAIPKDILNNLSLLEGLYVISSYSSMQYKNQDKTNKQIATELGVAFLLKGTTHKFGDNLRVNAELIDAITDKTVWKKSYSNKYSDIMLIESEISKDVVDALRLKLSFDDMQNVVGIPTGSIEAYNLFIKGRNEADKRTALGNKNSIDLYSQAIRIDTSFAESYVELANSTLNKVTYNDADPKDIEKLTSLYLEKAENLNDQLAKIYSVRGYLNILIDEQDMARSNLERAIELAPNDAKTRLYLAEFYRSTNQPKKQLLQNKLAYQLNPLDFKMANSYVSALILNKEFDEAEKLLKNINELLGEIDPVEMDRQYVKLYLAKKDYEKSLLPLIRLSDIDSTYLGALGYSYSKIGDTTRALSLIDTIKLKRKFESQNYNIAKIYAGLGQTDSTFQYLDSIGFKSRYVKDSIYHFFDFIKDDKKFKGWLSPRPISKNSEAL